jgi:hypothetical protein
VLSVKSVDDVERILIVAKQVTCNSCRRSFLVPEEIGDFWVLCPYCEKLNPRAQQDMRQASKSSGTLLGVFGVILLILGILGGLFGSFMCLLTFGLRGGMAFPAIWLISSACFIGAGSLLIQADSKGGFHKFGWPALWVVVFALAVGACGWIVILETCSGGF